MIYPVTNYWINIQRKVKSEVFDLNLVAPLNHSSNYTLFKNLISVKCHIIEAKDILTAISLTSKRQ